MNNNYNSNIKVVKTTGCDIGNEGCKTSKGVFLPSCVFEGNVPLNNNAIAIKAEWNGKFFIVGEFEQGVPFTNVDKVDTDAYNVTLLVSIALSYPQDSVINTVVGLGLPYEYYHNNVSLREKYKQKAIELGSQTISIYIDENTKITKTINILDAYVYAQGDILSSIPNDKIPAMVVDFGGGTLDITRYSQTSTTEMNGDISRKVVGSGTSSTAYGFNRELDTIINLLKTNGVTSINTRQELITILNQDTIKMFGREDVNLKAIKDKVLIEYSGRVLSHLLNSGLLTYPNLYFMGGCAELVKEYLVIHHNVRSEDITVLKNSRFYNALIFNKNVKADLDKNKFISEEDFMNQQQQQI